MGISATNRIYAGGGGVGGYAYASPGGSTVGSLGGSGIGGRGGPVAAAGNSGEDSLGRAAVPNTGSGGGSGGAWSGDGGAGSTGIVIIRYEVAA
jgi:hypothetical protein